MASVPSHNSPTMESSIFPQLETDPELVHPDEKYFCPIHGGLLRQPTQTPCGHRLCRDCLLKYLNGEESKPCPVEDEEREEVSEQNVYPDPGILREIKTQEVYCPLKDKGCKDTMKYKDVNYHINQNCPETLIPCPYSCGTEKKRIEMENHSNACTLKPKECAYNVLGCPYVGTDDEIAKHGKNMESHFETLVTFVCDMKMNMRTYFASPDYQHFVKFKENTSKVEAILQKMTQDFQVKDISLSNKFATVENSLEEARHEQRLVLGEIVELKENLKKLSDEITKSKDENSGELPKYKMMELRLAESDVRFQMIETTSYNGTLLWKIRDFTIRRRDAVQGKTVSLYSQPFYTSRYGYKMCARVYLNGDGIGKGTHISLYFVVMKGQYDALLPWPFQPKITLMVLDQSPNKKHMKDSFTPDPSSTSFQRPNRAEMNVASGCPLFMAHSIIDAENSTYVKDDTIFVMVSVDCSSIPPI